MTAAAMCASLLAAPHATAQDVPAPSLGSLDMSPDFTGANAFYMPPEQLPGAPGQLIRSEPMDLNVTLPNVDGPWPGKAERFMYTSLNSRDEIVAVTGFAMDPIAEWTG